MASIRRHGDGWQARIRRKVYPIEIKTFSTKADAEQWTKVVEADMGRGQFVSREKAEKTKNDKLPRLLWIEFRSFVPFFSRRIDIVGALPVIVSLGTL